MTSACHVFESAQILMIDGRIDRLGLELTELAQRHRRARLGAHRQHEQIAEIDASRKRHLQDDDRLLEIVRALQRADFEPAGRHRQLAIDVFDRNAEHLSTLPVDVELDLVVRRLHVGVDVGDVRGPLHYLHDVARDFTPDLGRRAVEFDDHRREHRRAGRRLGDGQARMCRPPRSGLEVIAPPTRCRDSSVRAGPCRRAGRRCRPAKAPGA